MNKVVLSSELNNYNSKALIRAKVKEHFSEFSDKISELIDESGPLTSKEFEMLSGFSGNFYNEYCNQLKALFETQTSISMGKRSGKNLYISYKSQNYVLTQQGLTEKAPIIISKFTEEVPLKETLHDLEKACLKLRFNQ
ncbi:hypothetical protein AEA09_01025 [Lysinibacillus contaminans]|uniref:Uncharacterized protein n=1 Tax=Lysinibacillus contaminans TaxID=1293441 RepID=A0ABR5K5U0_9BACI|nr:hypothetical protein [Lysinibacillus contaminans]KOS71603.1 hypothetical protein AEA09_01025 [Lysinibacillus contaminans]